MARTKPLELYTPGPGIMQLEDDNTAPLLAPEHMMIMALDAKARAETRCANAELIAGHLTTVVCALMELIKNNPHTAYLIDNEEQIIIPTDLSKKVTGMQIEAIQTADGDVGIKRRERAPKLIVGL